MTKKHIKLLLEERHVKYKHMNYIVYANYKSLMKMNKPSFKLKKMNKACRESKKKMEN